MKNKKKKTKKEKSKKITTKNKKQISIQPNFEHSNITAMYKVETYSDKFSPLDFIFKKAMDRILK